MKSFIMVISIFGLLVSSQLVFSDSITDSYNIGDTLTAGTLNNIKSAVNDNDSRISVLEGEDLNTRMAALEAAPKANIATTAPTVDDDINDGYPVGSVWVDIVQKDAYILIDSAAGAANWRPITRTYAIGQLGPAGGVVFYVYDGGTHGLEASPVDLGPAEWGCSGSVITGADNTGIGTGASNTADILSDCPTPGIAAAIADAYVLNGFGDWFLPSPDELELLVLQRSYMSGFIDSTYWTSTEVDSADALIVFLGGGQFNLAKTFSVGVRAIRAF